MLLFILSCGQNHEKKLKSVARMPKKESSFLQESKSTINDLIENFKANFLANQAAKRTESISSTLSVMKSNKDIRKKLLSDIDSEFSNNLFIASLEEMVEYGETSLAKEFLSKGYFINPDNIKAIEMLASFIKSSEDNIIQTVALRSLLQTLIKSGGSKELFDIINPAILSSLEKLDKSLIDLETAEEVLKLARITFTEISSKTVGPALSLVSTIKGVPKEEVAEADISVDIKLKAEHFQQFKGEHLQSFFKEALEAFVLDSEFRALVLAKKELKESLLSYKVIKENMDALKNIEIENYLEALDAFFIIYKEALKSRLGKRKKEKEIFRNNIIKPFLQKIKDSSLSIPEELRRKASSTNFKLLEEMNL